MDNIMGNVNVGGDFNVTMKREIWGRNGSSNSLLDFFIHNLEEENLCDVEPIKMTPTWRNNCLGEYCFSKRISVLFFK